MVPSPTAERWSWRGSRAHSGLVRDAGMRSAVDAEHPARRRDLIDDRLLGIPVAVVANRASGAVKYFKETLGREVCLASPSGQRNAG